MEFPFSHSVHLRREGRDYSLSILLFRDVTVAHPFFDAEKEWEEKKGKRGGKEQRSLSLIFLPV